MSLGSPCHIPVLFLIHRRLGHATRVLEALKLAQPEVLLIAADGPSGDEKCEQVRERVVNSIDWPCQVETRFLDEQQGCRRAVSSALDWAFSLHDQLIILEDDCVPHPSFFAFCAAMLDRFKDEPEVMQICGCNLTGMHAARVGAASGVGKSGSYSKAREVSPGRRHSLSWRRDPALTLAAVGKAPLLILPRRL